MILDLSFGMEGIFRGFPQSKVRNRLEPRTVCKTILEQQISVTPALMQA